MKKLDILVVDDAYFMRELIIKILEEAKHNVVGEAKDGLEAIQMYSKLKPDLVTMDIDMPKMDGIKATKKIIKQSSSANILIISDNTDKKEEALNAGAVGFLRKPFQPAFLWTKIDSLIDKGIFVVDKNKIIKKNNFIKTTNEEDDLLSLNIKDKSNKKKNKSIVKKIDDIEFEVASKPSKKDILTIKGNNNKSTDENTFVFPKEFDSKYQSENKLSRENVLKKQQSVIKKYNKNNKKDKEPIKKQETNNKQQNDEDNFVMVSIRPPRGKPIMEKQDELNNEEIKEIIINPYDNLTKDDAKKETSLLDIIKNKLNLK